MKRPAYILAFGVYIPKQENVSGIKIFRAQFLALHLRKVMLKHLPVCNFSHQMQIYLQVFGERMFSTARW